MLYFGILTGMVIALLIGERLVHDRSRDRIPHRIHVNGIRGKSSVTRLIAAGLRGGGIATWGKVTGTEPNIIDTQGREIPIARINGSSLSEQRTVVALAKRDGVQALVIECMAVQPLYQQVAEDAFVHSTIGIITNVRPDHLEVYGDSLEGVARALSNTVPRGGVLYTTPGPAVALLERVAARRHSSVITVSADEVEASVVDAFPYLEHRENVAIALRVCASLGVDRATALAAMAQARPDPGILRIFEVRKDGKTIHAISAQAANDPDSTLYLYRKLIEGRWHCPMIVFAHSRRDRPVRTLQLGKLLADLPAARYVCSGNDVRSLINAARDAGVPAAKLIDCHDLNPAGIAGRLFDETAAESVVFAIGNTAAGGLETIEILAQYEHTAGDTG